MVSDKRMIRSRFGFTVVEVLVAMTVLTIGLLGILGVTGSTMRLLGQADHLVAVAYYANERMERLGFEDVINVRRPGSFPVFAKWPSNRRHDARHQSLFIVSKEDEQDPLFIRLPHER